MKTNRLSRRNFIRNAALTTGMAAMAPAGFAGNMSPGNAGAARSHREVWIAGFSQMWMRTETPEEMVEQIMVILKDLAPLQPDFVCLPELFPFEMINKTYPVDVRVEKSLKVLKQFSEFSAQNDCYTVCPVYTSADGKNYNSSVFFDRTGKQIGVYNKIHATSGEIDNGVTSGALHQPVIQTEFGPVGSQICFDINWDDGWMMLQKQGAKIVFWPSAFDGGKMIGTKAWEHKYVVATSSNQNYAKLCDISGDTIATTGIWNKYLFCAPVNLEKVFIHLWPYVNRFPEIQKKYGRKVKLHTFHEEQWAIIESLSPDVLVRDILSEFEIKTHVEHISFGEEAQNKSRS